MGQRHCCTWITHFLSLVVFQKLIPHLLSGVCARVHTCLTVLHEGERSPLFLVVPWTLAMTGSWKLKLGSGGSRAFQGAPRIDRPALSGTGNSIISKCHMLGIVDTFNS